MLTLILVTLTLSSFLTTLLAQPIVTTKQGKLAGTENLSRNGRKYFSFKGIPYGKAARWEESVPSDGWSGIRDASQFGESCTQTDIFTNKIYGQEDCLFLNVYAPEVKNSGSNLPRGGANDGKLLPVLVFIHGGGFLGGSSNLYGAKYFMDEDVVLVTINYRVGPFGFSDTGNGSNFGLKDQVLALRWVQYKISNFGGDPNAVTIFGESAGGMSVSLLMLSPLAKGLFHRAISQSGTANSPYMFNSDPGREFRKLGILMDCPIGNQEKLIQCLKKVDGIEMMKRIEASRKLPIFQMDDIPVFVPSVDSHYQRNVFLPDNPINLMQKGAINKVPWILGANIMEGLVFPSPLRNASLTKWRPNDAALLYYDKEDSQGLAIIRQFYLGNHRDEETVGLRITHLLSDRVFIHPTKVSAVLHSKHSPTYLYYFSLRGIGSILPDFLSKRDANGLKVAAHGDELQYLFDLKEIGDFPEIKAGSTFAPFSEFLVKIWASFAKNGIVAPEKLSRTAKLWEPITRSSGINDDIGWYQFNSESKMIPETEILGGRLTFWNSFLANRTTDQGRPIY